MEVLQNVGSTKDFKLAKKLYNRYIKEHTVDTSRGECGDESFNFGAYLFDLGYEIAEDFTLVEGAFIVDNPVLLPITLDDLYSTEYEEFLALYEDDVDITDSADLSEKIFEYLTEYKKDRLKDVQVFFHVWIEFRGVIIDVTQKQFSNAVEGEITEDNYV